MKKAAALLFLTLLLTVEPIEAAVRGKKAMYVDGTISSIQQKTKGLLELGDERAAVFVSEKGQQRLLEMPYDKVTRLEYGQNVQRRIRSGGAVAGSTAGAVAGGVLAAPVVIPLLLSKRRKHYVTIFFEDSEGKQQVCIFELAKDIVRPTLKILEARSGKQIEFETEEAKKKMTEAK
jgi:hypothetical protein